MSGDAAVLRDELRSVGNTRSAVEEEIASLDCELGLLLAEAQAHPEITVSEAARLAGVGRSLAYKLMRKSSRSDIGSSKQTSKAAR